MRKFGTFEGGGGGWWGYPPEMNEISLVMFVDGRKAATSLDHIADTRTYITRQLC